VRVTDEAVVASRDAAIIADLSRDAAPERPDERYLTRPCRIEREGICLRRDLDRFYEELFNLWFGRSDARAIFSQWGDSLVNNDYYTDGLRRGLQERFGDAGYGFLYISNPIRHMGFQGIRLGLSDDWVMRSIIRHDPDNGPYFGLAGAEFKPRGGPTLTVISDFEENDREFQRFGILFRAEEGETGDLQFEHGDVQQRVELRAEQGTEGLTWIETGEPISRAVFRDFDPGLTYYGVIIETGSPGVMVDQMGLVSGRIFFLLKIDEDQWARHIELRDPDVVSLWYGVNSSGMERPQFQRRRASYLDEYERVLARVRDSQPDRDCLVISVATRGDAAGGRFYNDDSLDLVAEVQREASAHANCAFINAYEMVGGERSASQWRTANPPLMASDLHHFTVRGYWHFADLVEGQLLRGMIDYVKERRERLDSGYPPYWRIERQAEPPESLPAGEPSPLQSEQRERSESSSHG
jgi:hypothetical protein